MPCVEVSGTKANIYVYTGENGYGMYELETAAPNGVTNPNSSSVSINVVDKQIKFSETVAKAEVFGVTGQKFAAERNVANLSNRLNNGIYIVSLTDNAGKTKIEKIIIN